MVADRSPVKRERRNRGGQADADGDVTMGDEDGFVDLGPAREDDARDDDNEDDVSD